MGVLAFRSGPRVGGRQFGSGCSPGCDNFELGGCAPLPDCEPPASFAAFLTSLISMILQTNPSLISQMPIVGVTDGSNAAPGIVGEFQEFTASGSFPDAKTTQVVTVGPLQPGDWDIQAYCQFGGTGTPPPAPKLHAAFTLSPVPPGVSDVLRGDLFMAPGSAFDSCDMTSKREQANITVPTTFSFNILTEGAGTTGGTIGNFALHFSARRMR